MILIFLRRWSVTYTLQYNDLAARLQSADDNLTASKLARAHARYLARAGSQFVSLSLVVCFECLQIKPLEAKTQESIGQINWPNFHIIAKGETSLGTKTGSEAPQRLVCIGV